MHFRKLLFGEVQEGKMIMNFFGEIVYGEWMNTSKLRSNAELDQFVIMPNHLHGIIILDHLDSKGMARHVLTKDKRHFGKPIAGSLSTIIGAFKSSATKQIHKIKPNIPIWHRNFYEHIIGNDHELYEIRKYIVENPLKWVNDLVEELDRNNPQNLNIKFQEKIYVRIR
jgi:REP element-mobilizing transposase RayT